MELLCCVPVVIDLTTIRNEQRYLDFVDTASRTLLLIGAGFVVVLGSILVRNFLID